MIEVILQWKHDIPFDLSGAMRSVDEIVYRSFIYITNQFPLLGSILKDTEVKYPV